MKLNALKFNKVTEMFIIDDSQFHGISFIPSFVVNFLNVCYVDKITQKQIILRQLLLRKMRIFCEVGI